MIEAMNNQFTRERQNEAIYRALADALRVIGYNGTAGWLDSQADGEGKHARRIAHYLTDKGVAVAYAGLEAVTVTVTGMGDAMAAASVVEAQTTAEIYALYHAAVAADDLDAQSFLNWFIDEQREEQAVTRRWLQAIQLADGNTSALLMIDRQMAKGVIQ